MAQGFSDVLENAILNGMFKGSAFAAYAPIGTVYVSLHTATLNDDGTGTEVTGTGYYRGTVVAAGWDVATGGTIQNASAINFGTAGAAWGTITNVGIWNAASAGTMLYAGTLTASAIVNINDTFQFAGSALKVALD
jgi:hypothetical protein